MPTKLSVAGQRIRERREAAELVPNDVWELLWDGTDGTRFLQGRQRAIVRVAYAYPLIYGGWGTWGRTFARLVSDGVWLTFGSTVQRPVEITQRWEGDLGLWESPGLGLGGWSLNVPINRPIRGDRHGHTKVPALVLSELQRRSRRAEISQ